MKTDIEYSFFDNPIKLSPKKSKFKYNLDIKEVDQIDPSDKVLAEIVDRFSPKSKSSFFVNKRTRKRSRISPKKRKTPSPKRKNSRRKSPRRKR